MTTFKSREHGTVKPGQVVQVALGGSNQNVWFNGLGCVGTDGTVTVREAVLHAAALRDGDHMTTTTTPTTTTTRGGDGDHKPPPTTTTTTATTTTTPGL